MFAVSTLYPTSVNSFLTVLILNSFYLSSIYITYFTFSLHSKRVHEQSQDVKYLIGLQIILQRLHVRYYKLYEEIQRISWVNFVKSECFKAHFLTVL